MILIDVNLLVYAYNKTAPEHAAARRWFEDLAAERPFLLPWHSVLGFVRIVTHPRSAANPFSPEQASAIVDEWLAQPHATPVSPGPRHWEILRRLLTGCQCRGPLVPDAHLAALAIEHGATLATHDRGFARFTGLQVQYPLA
jgi:uncharacterized protein